MTQINAEDPDRIMEQVCEKIEASGNDPDGDYSEILTEAINKLEESTEQYNKIEAEGQYKLKKQKPWVPFAEEHRAIREEASFLAGQRKLGRVK